MIEIAELYSKLKNHDWTDTYKMTEEEANICMAAIKKSIVYSSISPIIPQNLMTSAPIIFNKWEDKNA